MTTVTIKEAQESLSEIIHRLSPGEEVVIIENDRPIARLVVPAAGNDRPKKRRLGSLAGTVRYVAPDFNAPLPDFKEHER